MSSNNGLLSPASSTGTHFNVGSDLGGAGIGLALAGTIVANTSAMTCAQIVPSTRAGRQTQRFSTSMARSPSLSRALMIAPPLVRIVPESNGGSHFQFNTAPAAASDRPSFSVRQSPSSRRSSLEICGRFGSAAIIAGNIPASTRRAGNVQRNNATNDCQCANHLERRE